MHEDAPAITHLLVDYGGVVSRPQPAGAIDRLARIAGLDTATMERRYWEHRPGYDLGSTAAAYWARVLDRPVDGDALGELIDVDVAGWSHLDPATLDVLGAARRRGLRLTLLSNAPHELARVVRDMPAVTGIFGDLLFSAELGAVKPDPAAFHAALEGTGTRAGETLFVDDRAANAEAAAALGMRAVRFTTAGGLARALDGA